MSLLIDAVIILALAGAVAYGLVLSSRLSKLLEILRDLEPAITAFSSAVDKTENSASGLRAAAIKLAEEVGQVKGARTGDRSSPAPARVERKPRSRAIARPETLADEGKSDLVRGFFATLQARSDA